MTTQRLKRKAKQVLQAVKNSYGIRSVVARRLDVSRQTLYSYERRWRSVTDAIQAEADVAMDHAELNVTKAVLAGDLPTSKWLLAMKGAGRGYGLRPADLPSLPGTEPITEVSWKDTAQPEESKPPPSPEELGAPHLSPADLGLPPEEPQQ
jgi:hypothetical protein